VSSRLSDEHISRAFRRAVATTGLIHADDTAILFYDLSFLEQRVRDLQSLFPPNTLHAIAIKANPLAKVLERVCQWGAGAEAASLPEIHLALNAGFPPKKIVFDSPVKTRAEIEFALNLGIHINADSLEELDRIAAALNGAKPKGTVGVRINPQVGTGKILSTSVAGDYSKFGVPIHAYRQELIERFLRFDWLSGVHIHIGSQGCEPALLLRGIERMVEFVDQTHHAFNQRGIPRRIQLIDIGGGLPASYARDARPMDMRTYQKEIAHRFPQLFSGDIRLITEFGRYIHANAGWLASRVEYVKRDPGIHTAAIHVGADMFLRECYHPDDWPHEVTVLDHAGNAKAGLDENPYMIAGPLCFAGDLLAREIRLSKVQPGDYIIIHDAGAYTLSMWSRYNSRQTPKVIGYYQDGERFEVLKERESIQDILDFWA